MAVEQQPKFWGPISAVGSPGDLDTIATLPDGGYVVAWRQNSKIVFQIYDGNGAATVGPSFVAEPTNTGQWQPDIYTKADGSFVITWTEATGGTGGGRHVRSQTFDMHGNAVVGSIKTVSTTARHDGVHVTTNGDSGLMTAFIDEISANVFQLKLVETRSDGSQGNVAAVGTAGGDVSLDWLGTANGHVVTYFNSNGAAVVGIVKNGALAKSRVVETADEANVVALQDSNGEPNGKFIVTYHTGGSGDQRRVKVATYHLDSAGEIVLDNTVELGQARDSNGLKTSIAALHDGGYAVAYKNGDGGATSDIWVKVFDASGTAGPALQIPVPGLQSTPSISEMADGRLSVSWQDWTGGGIGTVIVDARAHAMTVVGTGENDIYAPSKHAGDNFDGGAGIDTLTFKEAKAGVVLNLGAESGSAGDAAGDTYKNFENVIGSNFADSITGNAAVNVLDGGAGNAVLNGAGGADVMKGGAGADTYYVDNAGDRIEESPAGDVDTVYTSVSYELSAYVENMVADANAGAINLTGNAWNNHLWGNGSGNSLLGQGGNDTLEGGGGNDTLDGGDGNDVLIGGAGADRMTGGAGNDTYYIDDLGDVVVDASGVDTVVVSVAYDLTKLTGIENVTGAGAAAITLVGDAFSNWLVGNDGHNILKGGRGNDSLDGGAGNDKLYGQEGYDLLRGGSGRDIFVFDKKPTKSTKDKIADFNVKDDSIYLENKYFKIGKKGSIKKPAKLDKKMFYKGAKAHDGDDRIIYDHKKGKLWYDADGTGKAKAIQIADIGKNLKMTHADFFAI